MWCFYIGYFSHLLTYSPLHFGPLPSLSTSRFWPYRLSPGLAVSALVCLDSAFHLPPSVIHFSWHHLYLSFEHVQTISASSPRGIPPSGTCVPLSRCLHFRHALFSYFLLPTAACAFQLCAISSYPSF